MTSECYYCQDISSRGPEVCKELAGPEGFSDVPHIHVLKVHAPAEELKVDKELDVPGGVNSVLGATSVYFLYPLLPKGSKNSKRCLKFSTKGIATLLTLV